jgi:gamma-glutamyltranspeptidase/glutathione hydrolase
LADSDKVPIPLYALLDDRYLKTRRLLLDKEHLSTAEPGMIALPLSGRDSALERPSTTHFVIVDEEGRVVSMTSSIEDAFGSRIWVKGFLLNNQLTDFSFNPVDEKGRLVANRVEPGKRPRSSMAPTIVFDQTGKFLATLGSPGGSQIIPYVAQTLIALIDQHLTPQEAVNLPHFSNRNDSTEFEQGAKLDKKLGAALKAKGHTKIEWVEMESGLSAILKTPHGYLSGIDERREGLAMGE